VLEQQLVTSDVGRAEVEETLRVGQQDLARVVGVDRLGRAVYEARGSLAEHRVEDGVLRLEVRVHGGRRDPHPSRQFTQRQCGQAVLAHHLPRGRQDGGSRGLTACLTPTDSSRFL